jgi:hypothetical protein
VCGRRPGRRRATSQPRAAAMITLVGSTNTEYALLVMILLGGFSVSPLLSPCTSVHYVAAAAAAAARPPLYTRVTFERPVLVGRSSTRHFFFPARVARLNSSLLVPVSNSADSATPCTTNCSRLMQSVDDGATWQLALLNPPGLSSLGGKYDHQQPGYKAETGQPCVGPTCVDILDMYVEELDGGSLWTVGPARAPAASPNSSMLFATSQRLVSVGDGHVIGGERRNVTFSGFPPLMIAPNGTAAVYFRKALWAHLDGKPVLLTVGHSMDANPFIGQGVKKTTVFVARSDDGGNSFRYLSRVPCNSGSMSPWCERRILGPSEPTITQLLSGELLLMFRTTGTPCFKAYSHDGVSWTDPVMSPVWTVWPQLEQLSNGVIVATSGRPGLGMWWSTDGHGDNWTFANLAGEHNRLLPNEPTRHYNSLNVDCDYYGCQSCWMPSQHCARQTTSYTGLRPIAQSANGRNVTLLITYDRLANGWFGPRE